MAKKVAGYNLIGIHGGHSGVFAQDAKLIDGLMDVFNLANEAEPFIHFQGNASNLNLKRNPDGSKVRITETDQNLVDEVGVLRPSALVDQFIGGAYPSVPLADRQMIGFVPITDYIKLTVDKYSYVDPMVREGLTPELNINPRAKALGSLKTAYAYQRVVFEGALMTAISNAIAASAVSNKVQLITIPVVTGAEMTLQDYTHIIDDITSRMSDYLINTDAVGATLHAWEDDWNALRAIDVGHLNQPIIIHIYGYKLVRQQPIKTRKSDRDVSYEHLTLAGNSLYGINYLYDTVLYGDAENGMLVRGTINDNPKRLTAAAYFWASSKYYATVFAPQLVACGLKVDVVGTPVIVDVHCLEAVQLSMCSERLFGAYANFANTEFDKVAYPSTGYNLGNLAQLTSALFNKADEFTSLQMDKYIPLVMELAVSKTAVKKAGFPPGSVDALSAVASNFVNGYVYVSSNGGEYYTLPTTVSEKAWQFLRAVERDIQSSGLSADMSPRPTAIKGLIHFNENLKSHVVSTAKILRQMRTTRETIKNTLLNVACYDFTDADGAIVRKNVDTNTNIPQVRLL